MAEFQQHRLFPFALRSQESSSWLGVRQPAVYLPPKRFSYTTRAGLCMALRRFRFGLRHHHSLSLTITNKVQTVFLSFQLISSSCCRQPEAHRPQLPNGIGTRQLLHHSRLHCAVRRLIHNATHAAR